MSVENTESPDNDLSGGLHAVGQRLAAERQQQQLDVAAVAKALHLRPEVVDALESGDEQKLPAMAFVRGYFKAYIRLLGMDEGEVLALLPVAEYRRPAPLKPVGMRRRSFTLPLGKWLFWVIGLCAGAALLVYGVPVIERMLERGDSVVTDNVLALPPDGNESMPPSAIELPVPGDASGDETSRAEDTSLNEDVDDSPVDEDIEPPLAEELPAASESAAPLETPAAQPAAQPVASTGPATVTLRFREDSWVEMESNGRKLVVGIQAAGSERTVRAEPPVSILLGNAPGVELIYRGERVDLAPYRRGKVARLVLED